jgi:hypothetical protein
MTRFFILFGLVACTGTETGNPFRSEASLLARSTDESVVQVGGGTIAVDAVWVSVSRLDLVPCDTTRAPDPVVGPGVVELVSEGSLLAAFATPSSPYCSVELELEPASAIPAGAPAELTGRSIVTTGTSPSGPFVAADPGPAMSSLTLTGADPIAFGAEGNGFAIAFDLVPWFRAIDPATLVAGPDGIARVDEVNAAARLATWNASIATSATAHFDPNRNGHVDATEAAVAQGH